jgi:hypothetical protein
MARIIKNLALKGISGAIGQFIVLKHYKGKTVVSKYPDRSNVRLSACQKKNNLKFKRAVKYAQAVLANEKLRAKYEAKVKKGKSVFHYLIGEYMRR